MRNAVDSRNETPLIHPCRLKLQTELDKSQLEGKFVLYGRSGSTN